MNATVITAIVCISLMLVVDVLVWSGKFEEWLDRWWK